MKYENLHTYTLEKLFGAIKLYVLRQDDHFRIIELVDENGISRTLGVVIFFNINTPSLQEAHNKILSGSLLGKTLYDSNIDFHKKYIGSLEVKIPMWIKEDFKSEHNIGIVFFSRISVLNNDTFSLYSELIEVIPLELKDKFIDKINPLNKIDKTLSSLLNAAELEISNPDTLL